MNLVGWHDEFGRCPQHVDKCLQSGRHQFATRVIKVKAGNLRAPFVQHRLQSPFRHRHCCILGVNVGQTEALFGGLDHQRHFADGERPVDFDFKLLAAAGEFPAIKTAIGKTNANAVVLLQFARAERRAMLCQILRRSHYDKALGRTKRHGHHVLLQAFAEADAGIEAGRDNIDKRILGHQFDPHTGMAGEKTAEQRCQNQFASGTRGVDTQRAEWRVTKGIDLVQRPVNVLQRRRKAVEQAFAGFGGGDAARCPVEQAHAEAGFQSA